jgi:hypothetical protein
MTGRDILAAGIGAAIAASMMVALPSADRIMPAAAQAQQKAQPPRELSQEELRLLVLAIARAIASIAVDSERAALGVNRNAEDMQTLKERLAVLEGRLAELEKKR